MDTENSRPSFHRLMMDTARLWSGRSTCSRLAVGAVLAKENRIVTVGYNGAVAGLDHCFHGNGDEPCEVSVHAEENVIYFAAKYGISAVGTAMYVTHSPCYRCARGIVNAGVEEVIYGELYRSADGLRLLRQAGVRVCGIDWFDV